MTTADMERELAAISDHDLKEAAKEAKMPSTQEPVQFRPKTGPSALIDQVQQLERIERQIADRLRREGVELRCEAERKVTEAKAYHARSLAEETARIDNERDQTIRMVTEEFHTKLNELAAMIRRRS